MKILPCPICVQVVNGHDSEQVRNRMRRNPTLFTWLHARNSWGFEVIARWQWAKALDAHMELLVSKYPFAWEIPDYLVLGRPSALPLPEGVGSHEER